MTLITRRAFLRASSLATVTPIGWFAPRSFLRVRNPHAPAGSVAGRTLRDSVLSESDPDRSPLAMRALDAARTAGARYADVRFTTTDWLIIDSLGHKRSQELAMGIRACTAGSWGFAAATTWTPDSVALLGRQAVAQANATIWPNTPPLELGEPLSAMIGQWRTPIRRDPFTVPDEEVLDFLNRLVAAWKALVPKGMVGIDINFNFKRQLRTFASSEGTYVTQTVYTAFADRTHALDHSHLTVEGSNASKQSYQYNVPQVSPQGAGYEALDNIIQQLPTWLEIAIHYAAAKEFEAIGAYDVVFDAYAMATLLSGSCGAALEYDRAVGLEANAHGTSYLAPPSKILGTPWASPTVTVTADRTLPRGAATVGWDDDGVAPTPTTLVKDGVIVDYATSREFVFELAPWYQQRGIRRQSNGCAASESALTVPIVHTPNLMLQPGAPGVSVDTLLNGIDHGYAICAGRMEMDMQQLTGRSGWFGDGQMRAYTIRHGKLGAPVKDVLVTINSPELWHNVVALGGPETIGYRGLTNSKGQPNQSTSHTVQAVAAHVKNVNLQNLNSII